MAGHREAHTRHESEGDTEFSFWNSSNTTVIPSNIDCDDQLGGNEASFNREAVFGEKSKSKRKNSKLECSPFIPRSHHCNSSVSDPSRSKAIEEGRKELMEMLQGMPESSFELSFQDMVVDNKQVHNQDETSEEKTVLQSSSTTNGSSKALIKKPNNKKKSTSMNGPAGQIMRVESMDSETFLLKMFFPTSLKKVKVDKGSKVSPRPSLLESVKHVAKDWREKSIFQEGGNKGHAEDSSGKNTSSKSDKSRYFDRNISFSQSCWPFFHHTKSEKRKVGR